MVNDERAGFDDVRLAERRAAKKRANPCEQLEVHVARNRVVRPALEGAHANDRVRTRLGENDHGLVSTPGTYPSLNAPYTAIRPSRQKQSGRGNPASAMRFSSSGRET